MHHDPGLMQTHGIRLLPKGGPTPTRFQVLGERASGTNVIRKSLEKNTKLSSSDALGWKHGFPAMIGIPRDMIVVAATRNAFDWLRSMHKRPWHSSPELQELPFSDFIRAEWKSVVDRPTDFAQCPEGRHVKGVALQPDRHPITGQPFENLLALRRAKFDMLQGLTNRDCALAYFQLEAFARDPNGTLFAFRDAFGLPQPNHAHRDVRRRMGTRFRPTKADRPDTPQRISAEDRTFILSQIDDDLEASFGYRY
jgi:hypothetical protein